MLVPWRTLLISLGAGLARNLFGWWENAWEDKHISPYEKAELGATVTRVVIMTFGFYFPLNSFGIDAAGFAAAGSAIVCDFILKAIKKKKMTIVEEETKAKE